MPRVTVGGSDRWSPYSSSQPVLLLMPAPSYPPTPALAFLGQGWVAVSLGPSSRLKAAAEVRAQPLSVSTFTAPQPSPPQ